MWPWMARINVCVFIKGGTVAIHAYEPMTGILYCGLHGACKMILVHMSCQIGPVKLIFGRKCMKSGPPSHFWCHSQLREVNFGS